MSESPLTDAELLAIQQAVADSQHLPGALLPVLHGVQDALGYVPAGGVPLIAQTLNLSRAEVHGVISFYHHFRTTRPGRHTLQVCRAEACQSMGSHSLEEHIKRRLGIEFHETSADGAISLEPVYCLGNCAASPAIALDAQLHGRVDAQRVDALLEPLRPAMKDGA